MTTQKSQVTINRSIEIGCDRARAFEVFTAGIDSWWPREHHIGDAPMKEIFLEPKVGGRAYTVQEDGKECVWGSILGWEPPARLVFAWQITAAWQYDADFITEVEVTFTEQAPGRTLVELEHRYLERYEEATDQMYAALDDEAGWRGTLKLFAEAAEGRPQR